MYICKYMNTEYKYAEITEKVIGCAITVHNYFGSGFQEAIYQKALEVELTKSGINFIREMPMPIYYGDIQIGFRRVDFFVEDKIMVELKALDELQGIHFTQAINYLHIYNAEVGLLLNFGSPRLEFKRVYNQRLAKA